MLKITIPAQELFDPATGMFTPVRETTLILEHSLIALSKWESKWKKPLLDEHTQMTAEMFVDYVRCMTITQNIDPTVYHGLTQANINEIQAYMDDPMTATVIKSRKQGSAQKKFMTSELIYAHMAILRIPYECQKWHLNRLLTLIQVTNIEQEPPKKMSKAESMNRHRSLNAARRMKHPRM